MFVVTLKWGSQFRDQAIGTEPTQSKNWIIQIRSFSYLWEEGGQRIFDVDSRGASAIWKGKHKNYKIQKILGRHLLIQKTKIGKVRGFSWLFQTFPVYLSLFLTISEFFVTFLIDIFCFENIKFTLVAEVLSTFCYCY